MSFNSKEFGRYIIYSDGRVYSNITNKFLKPVVVNGYLRVIIGGKRYFVHRLVSMLFIDNPHNHDFVNHINGVKVDNRVDNLEWCDRSYNQKHSYRIGLQKPLKGYDNLLSKSVDMVDDYGNILKSYGSIQIAATDVGLKCYSNISRVCSGERKRAGGYRWAYSK